MVFLVRKVIKPLFYEIASFVGLIALSAFFVSLPNIIQNMLKLEGIKAFGQFIYNAFLHTQFIVQALSVLATFIIIAIVFDAVRRVRQVTFSPINT